MKRVLFYAMLSITCATLFIGCEKGSEASDGGLTIYGTVIDANTGSPIQNAQISVEGAVVGEEEQYEQFVAKYGTGELWGSYGSTVTGSDGTYEFTIYIQKNEFYQYSVCAEKAGYRRAEKTLHLLGGQKGGRQKFDFLLYMVD